jgi:hypothetical protein
MIALNILKYLQENGFGTISTDLFEGIVPAGSIGVGIIVTGGVSNSGRRSTMARFDLYCRGLNNVSGYGLLDNIRLFFVDNYDTLCTLPALDENETEYQKVRFMDIGNIESLPPDANNKNLYRLSAQINYQDNRGE